jgi:hypothetical protein
MYTPENVKACEVSIDLMVPVIQVQPKEIKDSETLPNHDLKQQFVVLKSTGNPKGRTIRKRATR